MIARLVLVVVVVTAELSDLSVVADFVVFVSVLSGWMKGISYFHINYLNRCYYI